MGKEENAKEAISLWTIFKTPTASGEQKAILLKTHLIPWQSEKRLHVIRRGNGQPLPIDAEDNGIRSENDWTWWKEQKN